MTTRRWTWNAVTIALAYLAVAVLWIAASDQVLLAWGISMETLTSLQTAKGVTFVLLTSALIYLLVRSATRPLETSHTLLRQSEAYVQNIINNVVDGIITIDERGTIATVNRSACLVFGYEEAELAGQNIRILMPEPDRSHHDAYLKHYRDTGRGKILGIGPREVTGRHRDGSLIPLELAISEVLQDGQRVFIGALRDISERKRQQRELDLAEERARLLLESAGEGIYGVDLQGRTSFINPVAAEMLGYSIDELMGQPMHDVLHHTRPDGTPYPKEDCPIYAAFMDGETRQVNDEVFWRKDGTSIPVEYSSTPIRRDGKLVGAVVIFNDISEELAARRALRDSEKRYRRLFDDSPISLWDQNFSKVKRELDVLKADGVKDLGAYLDQHPGQLMAWADLIEINDLNKISLTLYEAAEKDELINNLPRLLNDDGLMAFHRQLVLMYQGHTIASSENVNYTLTGKRIDVYVQVSIPPGHEETWDRVLVSILDISDLKSAERALRQSQQRLTNAQRIANLGSWEWNRISGEVIWSDQMYEIFGMDPQTFEPSFDTFLNAMHPDDRGTFQRDLELVVAGKRAHEHFYRIVRPDGETRTLHELGEATLDEAGETVLLSGTVHDVTERVEAERTMRELNAQLQNITNHLPGIVYRRVVKRDGTVEVPFIAGQLLNEIRLDGDDHGVKFSGLFDHVHPRDQALVTQRLQETVQSLQPMTHEFRVLASDGEVLWLQSSSHPHRTDDGDVVIDGLLLDITERKNTEEALRQSQKLETVGQLTGGIAHDFNNLLGIMVGNLRFLERMVQDAEAAAKRVDTVVQAARRGALLAFSRQESGPKTPTDVNEVLRGMEDLLKRTLTNEVEIQMYCDDGLGAVEIDPGELEDAVVNLAINARDAMPGGGKLVIETHNQTLSADHVPSVPDFTPGEFVVVAVSDTGSGIEGANLDKVLEPYFTTKVRGRGTGLGLSMVYGFVKRARGDIRIYSEIGHGTTVRLFLPRTHREVSRVAAATVQAAEAPRGTETVLAVDDEHDLLEIAETILSGLGYRVVLAESGHEALARLAQEPRVDLLFTDVIMPGGMDGFELAKRARERLPGLRVLMTSGFSGRIQEAASNVKLKTLMLNKPYDKLTLAQRVRKALDQPAADAA